MKLSNAEQDLDKLLTYLVSVQRVPAAQLDGVHVIHDHRHDGENAKDPRAFCFVEQGKPNVIRCAKAIESLPPRARVGVLLHEIGHILLDAFEGDESEVDVDAWCASLSGAGYAYKDTHYSVVKGDFRLAKSLQNVSSAFLRDLNTYANR